MWRSRTNIIKVDIASGAVTDIGSKVIALVGGGYHSVSLLDSTPTGLLARVESPVLPPQVVYVRHDVLAGVKDEWLKGWALNGTTMPRSAAVDAYVASIGKGKPVVSALPFAPAVSSPAMHALVDNMQWEMLQVKSSVEPDAPTFDAWLVRPKNANATTLNPASLPALVVYPHGGPHVASSTAFLLSTSYFCASNLAMLFINYRGSTAFGEDALHSLPGRAGTADVLDCLDATNQVLAMDPPVVDKNRVGVMGGSHGGFLGGHLIGQFPDLFKVCACVCVVGAGVGVVVVVTAIVILALFSLRGPVVFHWGLCDTLFTHWSFCCADVRCSWLQVGVLLNPVLNINSTYSFSDIPDWFASLFCLSAVICGVGGDICIHVRVQVSH